ncbi:MAG: cytochrome c [Nitrosomonadales bacterium]|nr:cytochrome c [Nitrosomonadales bacterium]
MKLSIALFLLLCGTAQATPFASGNAQAGKQLFDKNNCNQCHKDIVGEPGYAIFTRPTHKVKNPQQLVSQMTLCSGNVGITLSAQDEQDLGAYLNRSFYKFK